MKGFAMFKVMFVLTLILISSCATEHSSKKNIDYTIDVLTSHGKFEEAEKISANNYRINNARKCFPVIISCEDTQPNVNSIKRCQFNINQFCFGHNNSSYNYPYTIGNRLGKLKIKLSDELDNLSNKEAKREAQPCESGNRWSYKKEKSCGQCARSISINPKNLVGNFLTRDTCEEARILEDKVFDTGSACIQHYIGSDKYLESFELIAMSNFKQLILEFSTLEECENSEKNGFDYYDNDLLKHDLSPYGTTNSNRIISKCKIKKKLVCSKMK